jgi:hypothetical protein
MKKSYVFVSLLSFLMVFAVQAQEFVNEVFVGTGGAFGNPSDHVCLSSYSPQDDTLVLVGEVNTESMQDMCLDGHFMYLAAQDSIVKLDMNTHERVGIIACSNVNQLYVKGGNLYAGRWSSPADGIYVKVYDAGDLSWIADVTDISGDTGDLLVANDTLYVAVNGGWQGTEGKIAVIDNSNTLVREVNMGAEAVGIFDLFYSGGKIFTVNRSPYGTSNGSFSTYNVWTMEYSTNVVNKLVGKALDFYLNTLYLVLDGGVASYDFNTNEFMDMEIVGSAGNIICAGAYDHINQYLYVAETDYATTGHTYIYNMEGESVGDFEVGISTEKILIDYQYNDITFDDIAYWIGNGANKAMFVVDWNDGLAMESLAWGYQWDGIASGEEMIAAIAQADDRLTVEIGNGFINSIAFDGMDILHAGTASNMYWSTWSGTSTSDWEMNAGITTELLDNAWFGCSLTDFSPALAPGVPTAVLDPLGVEENGSFGKLFPNPTTGLLNIEALNIEEIRISDLQSRLVFQAKYSANSVSLDLGDLESGMYILTIFSSEGVSSRKILKK